MKASKYSNIQSKYTVAFEYGVKMKEYVVENCGKELEFTDQIWRNVENMCECVCVCLKCENGSLVCKSQLNFSSFISIFHFRCVFSGSKITSQHVRHSRIAQFFTLATAVKYLNFQTYSISTVFRTVSFFCFGWFVLLFFDDDDDGVVMCVSHVVAASSCLLMHIECVK